MVSRSRLVVCLVVGAVLAAGVVPFTVGAATYEITSPSAVDTPDRTVTVSGTQFEVSESARVSKGDPIRLDTTGPSGTTYTVELRDSDRAYVDDAEATGSDRVSFSTSSLTPGTYFAVVFADGNVQTLYPIVVKKYAVSTTLPSTVEAGAEFDVSARLTQEVSGPSLDAVEVAVSETGSEDIVVQEELSSSGSNQYAGTISVPDEGDYNVYIFVRGEDELDGERVLLGLSDPEALEVEASTDSGSSGGSGGGGGSGGSGASEPASTATPTATSTATPTETPVPTETPTEMPTETPSESTPADDSDSGSAGESADDSTAEPTAESTAEPTDEPATETSAPLGAVPMLLALLVVGGLAVRLRR